MAAPVRCVARRSFYINSAQDGKTSLPRKLRFASPDKIPELAKRGGAGITEHARSDLQQQIEMGRGAIWLNLTADQYRRLK